jgi:hypothetical protein
MFSLMDRVHEGIDPMLLDMEEHIKAQGLADMIASAETITAVGIFSIFCHHQILYIGTQFCCFCFKGL